MTDFTQILGVVDGFMTLGILVWFTYQHRQDIKELKKENAVAGEKHLADVKRSAEEYASLLEKTLVALNKNQDLMKDHLMGLETNIKKYIDDAFK